MEISLSVADYFMALYPTEQRQVPLTTIAQEDFKDRSLPVTFLMSETDYRFYYEVLRESTVNWSNIDDESIITKIWSTDLETQYPGMYKLLDLIVYEVFVLDYILDTDVTYIKYYKSGDLPRLRQNIRYACDWLGDYRAYRFLVEYLRELDVAVGYSENQLGFLLRSTDLRYSLGKLNF